MALSLGRRQTTALSPEWHSAIAQVLQVYKGRRQSLTDAQVSALVATDASGGKGRAALAKRSAERRCTYVGSMLPLTNARELIFAPTLLLLGWSCVHVWFTVATIRLRIRVRRARAVKRML